MVQSNYTTGRQPVCSCDGKRIGQIEGRIFKKKVYGSRHFLRSPRAIAIDADACDLEIAPSVERIEVYDKEVDRLYVSSVGNFNQYKIELDRGFGRQYALPLRYWEYEGKQVPFKPMEPEPKPNGPHQLSLAFDWGNCA